jgi:hypothetical protein
VVNGIYNLTALRSNYPLNLANLAKCVCKTLEHVLYLQLDCFEVELGQFGQVL